MKREFLQLAQKYNPSKYCIGGWWFSEKLDGERCFWDGGISRGLLKSQVPWANTAKDDRYVSDQFATGLWSRYGNVIHAPDWWLNMLPTCPLDGELYSHDADMSRQDIHSAIKTIIPINIEWKKIAFIVFDSPPLEKVFADGVIDNTNFKKIFKGILEWVEERKYPYCYRAKSSSAVKSIHERLGTILLGNEVAFRHLQFQLPYPQHRAIEVINFELMKIEEVGGEGLIIRNPNWAYVCERTHHMLKVKTLDDAEGTVLGCITGRATDKGSKLLGMMGALILKLDDGNRLELSGFTDQERELISKTDESAKDWAVFNPEKEVPEWIECKHFPRGMRVSFKYRGVNNSGIPNEARYWRKDERI